MNAPAPRPLVLYLHGFGSGPSSRKAAELGRRFREKGFDFEVPSLVPGPFRDTTLGGQLEVVDRHVGAALAEDPSRLIVLLGSSMGGYVAALHAARHPDQPLRLVLLAPAFGFPQRWIERFPEEEFDAWRERGERPFWHHELEREEPVAYRLVEEAAEHDDTPHVPHPVLVLHGTRDETVPIEESRRFLKANPEARLVELEDDHSLLETLDEIWNEIVKFLKLR